MGYWKVQVRLEAGVQVMSLGICLLLSVSRLYIFSDGSSPKLSEAIWRTPDGHDAGLGRIPLRRCSQEEKNWFKHCCNWLFFFFLRPMLRLRVVFENSCPQHGHRCCPPALVPSTLTLNLVPSLSRLIHLCDSVFRRFHKVPLHLCLFLCLSFCTCYPQSNQTQNWYSLIQPWPIIVPREVGFSDAPRTCSVSCELDLSCLAAWTQQDEGCIPHVDILPHANKKRIPHSHRKQYVKSGLLDSCCFLGSQISDWATRHKASWVV